MKRLALLLAAPSMLLAAVDGIVLNRTAGKPQAGAVVTLIRLGQGMESIGAAKSDEEGRFSIAQDLQASAPHLIQVLHQGVTYNTMLNPGASSTALQIPVFDSAEKVPEARITRHLIALQPTGEQMAVNEILVFTNDGNRTLNPAEGAIRFYLPPAVTGPIQVTVQGPQGMPLQRTGEKTGEPNVYAVKFPIRPGETRIDYNYTYPAKSPAEFAGRALHEGPVQLLVPQGVTLKGESVSKLGDDARIPGTIYQMSSRNYSLSLEGAGSFRDPGEQQAQTEGGGSSEDQPGIEQAKPRIYKRLPAVLAASLAMLAIGFVLLYRSSPSAGQPGKRA